MRKRNHDSIDKGYYYIKQNPLSLKDHAYLRLLLKNVYHLINQRHMPRITVTMKNKRIAKMKIFIELYQVLVQEFIGMHHINEAVQVRTNFDINYSLLKIHYQ